jgi:hypothetical protein
MKRLLYFFILLFTPHLIAYEHELAICAIFQNESLFLEEWLEFYKLIGVQHFYLYNNNSTDNYKEILNPYIQAGEVDIIQWDYSEEDYLNFAQSKAYNHCLNAVRGKVKWLAFLDIDEFLFSLEYDNLQNFLKNYEDYGAVCANWVMFGTSNIDTIPKNKLIIESLTMCSYTPTIMSVLIKSIVQPEKVEKFGIHNTDKFFPNFFQVTADKVAFEGSSAPSINITKLRINHYWARDEKWLREVKIPRQASIHKRAWNYSSSESKEWVLKHANAMNEIQDLTIQRFVEPLREILIQNKKD